MKRLVTYIGFLLLFFGLSFYMYKKYGPSKTDIVLDILDFDEMFSDDVFDYSTLTNNFEEFTPQKIKYLVVHCTANRMKYPFTKESLKRFFKEERGWSKPGYRHFIDKDGVPHDLIDNYNFDDKVDWNEITYGARGYNRVSIHISYDGGYDGDTRTEGQKSTLIWLVNWYRSIYPNIRVIPHNLLNSGKACPSFNVMSEYYPNFEMITDSLMEPDYLE